jgi:hypothetical protein
MNASEVLTNPTTTMESNGFRDVITLDERKVKTYLDQVVRDTLNSLLLARRRDRCPVWGQTLRTHGRATRHEGRVVQPNPPHHGRRWSGDRRIVEVTGSVGTRWQLGLHPAGMPRFGKSSHRFRVQRVRRVRGPLIAPVAFGGDITWELIGAERWRRSARSRPGGSHRATSATRQPPERVPYPHCIRHCTRSPAVS